jgi:hypothetical protein
MSTCWVAAVEVSFVSLVLPSDEVLELQAAKAIIKATLKNVFFIRTSINGLSNKQSHLEGNTVLHHLIYSTYKIIRPYIKHF